MAGTELQCWQTWDLYSLEANCHLRLVLSFLFLARWWGARLDTVTV